MPTGLTPIGKIRCAFGVILIGFFGACYGNPLILFTPESVRDLSNKRVLLLPNGHSANIESISQRCNAGRRGDFNAYDLASGQCHSLAAIGPASFHQPSMNRPLQGSLLKGRPVQVALDTGLFVWYDLATSRACVVGSCNTVFEPPPDEIFADGFEALQP